MKDPIMKEVEIADRLNELGLDLTVSARILRQRPYCTIQERLNHAAIIFQELLREGERLLEVEGEKVNDQGIKLKRLPTLMLMAEVIHNGMCETKSCKVGEFGINVEGNRYWSDELTIYFGEILLVAFSRSDLSEVYVSLSQTNFCVAHLVELSTATIQSQESEVQRWAHS